MTWREQISGAGQQEGPETVERKGWAVEPEEPRAPHGRQGSDRDEAADLPAFDFAAAWGGPLPLVRDHRGHPNDLGGDLDHEHDGERVHTPRSTDDLPSGATSDAVGEVFEVEDTSWLLVPPPVRAATSLKHLPDLPAGTAVALRHPGGGFLLDLVLTKSSTQVRATSDPAEQGHEPQEARHALVTSEAHWAVHRYLRDCTWYQRWAPARDLFVYSDLPPSAATAGPGGSTASDRTDGRAGGGAVRRNWAQELDRDPSLPPTQRPAPARESGSLLGRRLRFQAKPGDWQWVIASSEPYSDEHGAIVVRVVSITTWHLWHAHSFDNDGAVLTLPLERAWVY